MSKSKIRSRSKNHKKTNRATVRAKQRDPLTTRFVTANCLIHVCLAGAIFSFGREVGGLGIRFARAIGISPDWREARIQHTQGDARCHRQFQYRDHIFSLCRPAAASPNRSKALRRPPACFFYLPYKRRFRNVGEYLLQLWGPPGRGAIRVRRGEYYVRSGGHGSAQGAVTREFSRVG